MSEATESATTIGALPAEILDLIFFAHGDVIDRAIVGRVCRQWRRAGRCRWRHKGHRYERPTWIDIVRACCDGRESVARWLVTEAAHWHCPLGPPEGQVCVDSIRRRRTYLVPWLRDCGARWTARTRACALTRGYAEALDQGAADGLVMSRTDIVAIAESGNLSLLQSLDESLLVRHHTRIAISAARVGNLSVLEWLVRDRAYHPRASCLYAAGMGGHAAVVRWIANGANMAVAVEAAMAGDCVSLKSHRWSLGIARNLASIAASHGHHQVLNTIIDALPSSDRHIGASVCASAIHHLPKHNVLPFLASLAERFDADRMVSWLSPVAMAYAIARGLCDVTSWMVNLGCRWPWSNSHSRDLRKPLRGLVIWALIDAVNGDGVHMSLFFRALADGWKPTADALYRALNAMALTRTQHATRTQGSEVVIRALIESGHCPWTDKARRLALAVCSTDTALLALSGLDARDASVHIESIRATYPHRYVALVQRLGADL